MVHYYTGLIGMHDTITQDDLLLDADPRAAEVAQLTQAKRLLEDQLAAMSNEMKAVQLQVRRLLREFSVP